MFLHMCSFIAFYYNIVRNTCCMLQWPSCVGDVSFVATDNWKSLWVLNICIFPNKFKFNVLGSFHSASTSSLINSASGSSQEIKQRIEESALMMTSVLVPLKFGGIKKVGIMPKVTLHHNTVPSKSVWGMLCCIMCIDNVPKSSSYIR